MRLPTRSLRGVRLLLVVFAWLLAACGDPTATTTAPAATTAPAVATTAPVAATTAPAMSPSAAATTAPVATTAPATTAPATTAPAIATTAPAPASLIKVLATTTQIGDFVKNVGGNRVALTQILKPGDDPHDYEPTADDSKNAAAAQLVFKNGVGLDDWLDKLITNSGTKATVVNTSQGIKTRPGAGDAEKAGDPHIWFSTENAKQMVDTIAAGLSKVDTAGANYYKAQATAYKGQIDSTTTEIAKIFAASSKDKRKLVTNHDAFGYFCDEFGIEVVGSIIPNFSDAAKPSAQELDELIKNIKDKGVKVIFTETSINPEQAQQIAKAAGVKVYSNLFGDTLGDPGSDGETYLKMLLSNAKNMEAGFVQQ